MNTKEVPINGCILDLRSDIQDIEPNICEVTLQVPSKVGEDESIMVKHRVLIYKTRPANSELPQTQTGVITTIDRFIDRYGNKQFHGVAIITTLNDQRPLLLMLAVGSVTD